MDIDDEYKCEQHNLVFKKESLYQQHKDKCERLIKRNVCLYIGKDGKACEKEYNETGNLIIHYYIEHKRYACTKCCNVYKDEESLEKHYHPENLDLRQSESSELEQKINCNQK